MNTRTPLAVCSRFGAVAALLGFAFIAAALQAQTQTPTAIVPISILAFDSAYQQNFNSDASNPTPPGLSTGANNTTVVGASGTTLPVGWGFVEQTTDNSYRISDGSQITGDIYSYGATGSVPSTDRAFGTLNTSTNPTLRIGAIFTNNTGSTITTLTITYTGEQWRAAGASTDKLSFELNTSNPTTLTGTTGYVSYAQLDFTPPNTTNNGTTSSGAIDGNLAGNSTQKSQTITGLSIAPGSNFAIRWTDLDVASNDDGLAIDDFSLTAVPEPSTWAGWSSWIGGHLLHAAPPSEAHAADRLAQNRQARLLCLEFILATRSPALPAVTSSVASTAHSLPLAPPTFRRRTPLVEHNQRFAGLGCRPAITQATRGNLNITGPVALGGSGGTTLAIGSTGSNGGINFAPSAV